MTALAPLAAVAALLLSTALGLAGGLGLEAAGEGPLPLVPWVVDDHERVEGVPLLLTADVVVRNGGVLELLGVDAIVARPPSGPVVVRVEAGGALVLDEGVDIVTGEVRGTRFRGLGGAYELAVAQGAHLDVRRADFRDARIALEGTTRWSDATLDLHAGGMRVLAGTTALVGGTLRDAPGSLLDIAGGAAALQGVSLRDAGGDGVVVRAGADLRLVASTLTGAEGYGVSAEGGRLEVRSSTFEDLGSYAVRAGGEAEVVLEENTFRLECGAFLTDSASAIVAGNDFATWGHGVTVLGAASVAVVDNRFHGADEAVALWDSARALVQRNTFEDSAWGVRVRGGSAALEANAFTGNEVGLEVAAVADAAQVMARDNRFEGQAAAAVRNLAAGELDARWNWWGSPAGPGGPGADRTEGPVAIDPWLTEAPGP